MPSISTWRILSMIAKLGKHWNAQVFLLDRPFWRDM